MKAHLEVEVEDLIGALHRADPSARVIGENEETVGLNHTGQSQADGDTSVGSVDPLDGEQPRV